MSIIRSLPLFPLGHVLYPYERLPLHIFEERYKDLTQHCLEKGEPFGMVLFEEGDMAEVGSTARIERVLNRYEDGRMDIVVVGEERFRIGQLYDKKSYITADVEIVEEPDEEVDVHLRERAITQHMKLLELAGRTVRPELYNGVEQLSFMLAQNAGLRSTQKQKVLELASETERIQFLVKHFEGLLPRIEQREDVRRRIRSNGHFKDGLPDGE